MASKLRLLLVVLAAAALASATLTVTFDVNVNNRAEGIFGQEIQCYAYYAYLDYFGQPWTHPLTLPTSGCISGRTGDCETWFVDIPAPASASQVIEAVAYCQHNNGPKIWAQGTGNIKFHRAY
eukprot:m51a1_g12972 hypothetical protein (123) ;mRNA; f:1699-2262